MKPRAPVVNRRLRVADVPDVPVEPVVCVVPGVVGSGFLAQLAIPTARMISVSFRMRSST